MTDPTGGPPPAPGPAEAQGKATIPLHAPVGDSQAKGGEKPAAPAAGATENKPDGRA